MTKATNMGVASDQPHHFFSLFWMCTKKQRHNKPNDISVIPFPGSRAEPRHGFAIVADYFWHSRQARKNYSASICSGMGHFVDLELTFWGSYFTFFEARVHLAIFVTYSQWFLPRWPQHWFLGQAWEQSYCFHCVLNCLTLLEPIDKGTSLDGLWLTQQQHQTKPLRLCIFPKEMMVSRSTSIIHIFSTISSTVEFLKPVREVHTVFHWCKIKE